MGTRARDGKAPTTKGRGRPPLLASERRARANHEPSTSGDLIALHAESDAPPEWIEVLRVGTHGGRDGRGPYTVTDPEKIIATTRARGIDPVIDYDHATDYAAPHGQKSPAAGWMKDFKVENGSIWARVEWTPTGIAALAAREWRYFSPVFYHTPDRGEVTCILRGALTNSPNLELTPVAASMDGGAETIARLAKKFSTALPSFDADQLLQLIQFACRMADSAPDEPEDDVPVVAETYATEDDEMKITDEMVAKCAAKIQKGDAPTADELKLAREILETAAATKPAKVEDKPAEEKPAEEKKVAAAAVVAPSEADKQVIALQTQLNALNSERALEKATSAVDAAIVEKKLTPTQREWAIGFASQHPADFASFIANQVPVMAGVSPVAKVTTGGVALSKPNAAVCAMLGIDPKDFVAGYEASKDDPRSGANLIARHASL